MYKSALVAVLVIACVLQANAIETSYPSIGVAGLSQCEMRIEEIIRRVVGETLQHRMSEEVLRMSYLNQAYREPAAEQAVYQTQIASGEFQAANALNRDTYASVEDHGLEPQFSGIFAQAPDVALENQEQMAQTQLLQDHLLELEHVQPQLEQPQSIPEVQQDVYEPQAVASPTPAQSPLPMAPPPPPPPAASGPERSALRPVAPPPPPAHAKIERPASPELRSVSESHQAPPASVERTVDDASEMSFQERRNLLMKQFGGTTSKATSSSTRAPSKFGPVPMAPRKL